MDIKKIVITGGPCGGKTTGMRWIKEAFERKGYRVLFIPETATELISSGVAPWTCSSSEEYHKCQMHLQMAKEEVFSRAASGMDADRILIVCDRGFMDNKAYINSEEEFGRAMEELGVTEKELMERYDAVFHLVTAAKGAEEFYTTDNNTARTETVEEAADVDDRLISAWTGHPRHRIIGNSYDFDDKMKCLVQEIESLLGE